MKLHIDMKKTLALIILMVTFAIAISSCKTTERCDAYKSHQNHSKY